MGLRIITGAQGKEHFKKALDRYIIGIDPITDKQEVVNLTGDVSEYEVREPVHISTENIAKLFKGNLTEKEFRQVCNPFDNE